MHKACRKTQTVAHFLILLVLIFRMRFRKHATALIVFLLSILAFVLLSITYCERKVATYSLVTDSTNVTYTVTASNLQVQVTASASNLYKDCYDVLHLTKIRRFVANSANLKP